MQRLSSLPSRAEQVHESVREDICDCILELGTHLVQEELAATLGVSRQPIQQAMLLLKNDGLVVERGGRGLYVAPIDLGAMEHHYQIRLVLDQLAARLVAEKSRTDANFKARLRPNDLGARDLERELTFGQWNDRSRRLANALLGLGLQKGDRVTVLAYNRLEWAEIYAATAKAGLIAVLDLFRMEGGKIAEQWPAIDNIGLPQQIGML